MRKEELTRRCLGWYGTHTEPRILFDAGEGAQITDGICPDCLKRLDKEARKLSKGESWLRRIFRK